MSDILYLISEPRDGFVRLMYAKTLDEAADYCEAHPGATWRVILPLP